MCRSVFSLGDARITVPLVVKGRTLGLKKIKKHVTWHPNTLNIVRLNGPEINERSVSLVEPILNEIG